MSEKLAVSIYEGTPGEILSKIAEEFANLMEKEGHIPTGVHLLAVIQLVAACIRVGNQQAETHGPLLERVGKMPSFKAVLMLLTHNISNTPWTKEEAEEFNKEFGELVASLGGTKLPNGTTMQQAWISPSLGVH